MDVERLQAIRKSVQVWGSVSVGDFVALIDAILAPDPYSFENVLRDLFEPKEPKPDAQDRS